jgi:hypothetical protein
LASLIDAGSAAEVPTGESAEANHPPVVNQNGEFESCRGARKAGYLAAVIDAQSFAEVGTGQSTEASGPQTKSMGVEMVRWSPTLPPPDRDR